MDTNKAAYWVALGVLALGLNSEYQHGNFAALHQVAERTSSTLCRISTRAAQTLTALGIRTNFALSHFAKSGYSNFAQRFSVDN
jgi:hypothetical protein